MQVRHPNHRPLASLPVELRRTGVPSAVRAWIHQVTGAPVLSVRRLAGASSAAVHRVWLSDGRHVVVRRYVWRAYTEEEPEAPGREVDALTFASHNRLPAPRLIDADLEGAATGDGVPILLMSYVPGRALASPDVRGLAEAAAAVHAVDPGGFGHRYFRWEEAETTLPPTGTCRRWLWERAVALWRTAEPTYRPAFIHRDFHPGNVLWSRRRVTGVVDWVNACAGPAGCDVATCRSNLLDWAGEPAARAFVAAYESVTGEPLHPYWELATLLESSRRDWTVADIAAAEVDLARLVRALA